MDATKFGSFVARTRKDKNMTQAELAIKIKVTDKAVSRWERGLGFPDINTLEPLAEALGVSVLELMKSEKIGTEDIQCEDATVYVFDYTVTFMLLYYQKRYCYYYKIGRSYTMAIGERIKRIRTFRKLTQAQLGEAVSLSDVRIRQYEIGNRTPKEDMIQELAKALDCNYRSIYEPSLYAAEDVMYALFELDEHYNMPLYEVANPEDPTEKHIAVGFDYSLLDDFLNTWKKKKEDLASGKITKEEYFEWKINWPHAED